MKVLGVTFSDTLSLSPLVKYLSAKSVQTAFALRTLHAHGLSGEGPMDSDSSPHQSHGSHMPAPRGGVLLTLERGSTCCGGHQI